MRYEIKVCQIKKFGFTVNDKDFLKYIVFMDKTFLNIKGHINGQNCHIYEYAAVG